MTLTMKQISLPAVTITLKSLASIIDKAIIFTQTKKLMSLFCFNIGWRPICFRF